MSSRSTILEEICRGFPNPHAREYAGIHLNRFRVILQIIPKDRALDVLDIGTFLPFAVYLKKNTPHRYVLHGGPEGRAKRTIEKGGTSFDICNFDVQKDRFPFEDESFDLVLCCEVLEHLGLDPMAMLAEIHRVCRTDGQLLLTTPNVASLVGLGKILCGGSPALYDKFTLSANRHNREYSAKEVVTLLQHAGFVCEKVFTREVYVNAVTACECQRRGEIALKRVAAGLARLGLWRGDTTFVLARKAGPIQQRYPHAFYDLPRRAVGRPQSPVIQ